MRARSCSTGSSPTASTSAMIPRAARRRRRAVARGARAPRSPPRARRGPARRGRITPMAAPRAFLFDAYGTLFDVHTGVEAGRAVTDDPQALSTLWRQKQLEYTWLRSLMDRYVDFWEVTQQALSFAFRRLGLQPSPSQAAALMGAFPSPATLPDRGPATAPRRAG